MLQYRKAGSKIITMWVVSESYLNLIVPGPQNRPQIVFQILSIIYFLLQIKAKLGSAGQRCSIKSRHLWNMHGLSNEPLPHGGLEALPSKIGNAQDTYQQRWSLIWTVARNRLFVEVCPALKGSCKPTSNTKRKHEWKTFRKETSKATRGTPLRKAKIKGVAKKHAS